MLPPFYPILDTRALASRGCSLLTAVRVALETGARILQIRHKEHWSRRAIDEANQVAQLCREAGAIPIVNDRADIAAIFDTGLHVGQDDLPATDARRIVGPNRLLGLSTHNVKQIVASCDEPVDYIALGPFFATASKENPDPVVGAAQFQEWVAFAPCPVVAIGGITRANAREAIAAGADSVAIISDLLPDPCTESNLRERFQEWHRLLKQ